MKDELAALINAYASARMTQDQLLIEMAGNRLNHFLAGVELSPVVITEESSDAD